MKNIIDLLILNNFYGVSQSVDIAKGKYKIPTTFSEVMKLWKRIWKSK
jgi:hypothetical protein